MTQNDFEALCRRLNPSPWQQVVLYEELYNPWHTGKPTEFGWYVYEASSGGCYFTYVVDNEASLDFLGNTNFVRRWQKIEETD